MEDLDRLLAAGDLIEPSSGFAASMMEAERREQRERPPVPFSWPRLSVGLAAAVALAALGAVLLSRAGLPWPSLPLVSPGPLSRRAHPDASRLGRAAEPWALPLAPSFSGELREASA